MEEARNRFPGQALLEEAAEALRRLMAGADGRRYADSYMRCSAEGKAEMELAALCAEIREENEFATWEDYERSLAQAATGNGRTP